MEGLECDPHVDGRVFYFAGRTGLSKCKVEHYGV